jgi:uncharacterized protein YunC (DUF1805 family)
MTASHFFTFETLTMQHSKTMMCLALAICAALQGCTVLAIADTVGTVAVRTAGVAANAAISTAAAAKDVSIATTKIGVKVVGAVVDAAIPDK